MTPLERLGYRESELDPAASAAIARRVRFAKLVGSIVVYERVSTCLESRRNALVAAAIEKRIENAEQLATACRHRKRTTTVRCAHDRHRSPQLAPLAANAPPVDPGTQPTTSVVGADLGFPSVALGSTLSRSTPGATAV